MSDILQCNRPTVIRLGLFAIGTWVSFDRYCSYANKDNIFVNQHQLCVSSAPVPNDAVSNNCQQEHLRC